MFIIYTTSVISLICNISDTETITEHDNVGISKNQITNLLEDPLYLYPYEELKNITKYINDPYLTTSEKICFIKNALCEKLNLKEEDQIDPMYFHPILYTKMINTLSKKIL